MGKSSEICLNQYRSDRYLGAAWLNHNHLKLSIMMSKKKKTELCTFSLFSIESPRILSGFGLATTGSHIATRIHPGEAAGKARPSRDAFSEFISTFHDFFLAAKAFSVCPMNLVSSCSVGSYRKAGKLFKETCFVHRCCCGG